MGAAVAGLVAADKSPAIPLTVAGFVMMGGVSMAFMIPSSPLLFTAVDLAGYLPAGYLGWTLATQLRK